MSVLAARRRRQIPPLSMSSPYLLVTAIYVVATLLAGGFMLLMHWADPGRMVLPLTYPWDVSGPVFQGLSNVWFIFAWGVGVTALIGSFAIRRGIPREDDPGSMFRKGLWLSANAGFFEEIIYRWFAFYSAMVIVVFFDTITFHLVHMINEYILIPLANFMTLGALHDQLYSPNGWMFGAAIVAASVNFRDVHEGGLRPVNAWFLGMVFFWLLFHYGIVAAILAHVLYDVCVFTTGAICARFQPEPTLSQLLNRALVGLLRS